MLAVASVTSKRSQSAVDILVHSEDLGPKGPPTLYQVETISAEVSVIHPVISPARQEPFYFRFRIVLWRERYFPVQAKASQFHCSSEKCSIHCPSK
jgi:hypothetical protein